MELSTKFYDGLGEDFRNKNLYNLIIKQLLPGSVLDVACGSGHLIKLLPQETKVVGLDLDKKRVFEARKLNPGRDIRVLDALKLMDISEQFDNVLLIDILEHVEKDGLLLQLALDRLKPAGRLIIATSQYKWLFSKKDRIVGHCRRYEKRDLVKMLEKLEIMNIKVRNWDFIGFSPYLASVYFNFALDPDFRRRKSLLNAFLDVWFKLFENKVDTGMGLSLIITGEKKWQDKEVAKND